MSQELPLAGKVALVTGASRGIGKAIALEYADLGADLVLVARTKVATADAPGTIGEAAAAVEAKGRRAVAVPTDLLDPEQLDALPERALAAFGHVDILVNNAAYMGDEMYDGFFELTPESFRTQLECNVSVPYQLMKAFIPAMVERGWGQVVNVSSGFSLATMTPFSMPKPGDGGVSSVYGASKAAVNLMSALVAGEVREHGVSVISLHPGFVATERAVAIVGPKFKFDTAYAHSMDVPAKAAGYLATCPDPLVWSGQVVDAAELVRLENLLPA